MLKTIAAIHNGGGNDKLALIITLNYDHEKHPDFDPEAAIRAAAADYLHTNQGKAALEDTCGNFNYGDFVNYVPDHMNKKHGFVIQEVNIVSIVTDHNEDLRPDDMR